MIANLLANWRLKREIKETKAMSGRLRAKLKRRQAIVGRAGESHNSTAASTGRTEDTGVVAMRVGQKRHYNKGEGEFMLEPLSDSVVRVTHRDQVGYFGFNRDWEPYSPYTYTDYGGIHT